MIEKYEAQTITLADLGFQSADGLPANLKLCARGTWNERMLIETVLSMVTVVGRLKHIFHRVEAYAEMHLAYISALFNMLLALNRALQPDANPEDRLLHIAQFSL